MVAEFLAGRGWEGRRSLTYRQRHWRGVKTGPEVRGNEVGAKILKQVRDDETLNFPAVVLLAIKWRPPTIRRILISIDDSAAAGGMAVDRSKAINEAKTPKKRCARS